MRASVGQRVEICGVGFDPVTEDDVLQAIARAVTARTRCVIHTANVDHVMRGRSDFSFMQIMQKADIVTADGMPIVWAARLLGTPLPARVTGADLTTRILELAAKDGHRVFLFGGRPEVAVAAVSRAKTRWPGLNISFHAPSPAEVLDTPEDVLACLSRSDIVLVALGSPKQEQWIDRYRGRVETPVMIGVGAAVDFLAGSLKRAPRFLQAAGLEWAWRLAQEPRRLWRRYLVRDLPFVWLVLCSKIQAMRKRRII